MKVGKAQNVVIASRERETVAGYQTDNRSGGNLIALLCLTDRPMGRTSRGYCSPRSRHRGLGLEGLIGKRSGSRYEAAKRSGTSFKIKRHQEQEFAIGGYTDPEGARNHFGALLVGFYEARN